MSSRRVDRPGLSPPQPGGKPPVSRLFCAHRAAMKRRSGRQQGQQARSRLGMWLSARVCERVARCQATHGGAIGSASALRNAASRSMEAPFGNAAPCKAHAPCGAQLPMRNRGRRSGGGGGGGGRGGGGGGGGGGGTPADTAPPERPSSRARPTPPAAPQSVRWHAAPAHARPAGWRCCPNRPGVGPRSCLNWRACKGGPGGEEG